MPCRSADRMTPIGSLPSRTTTARRSPSPGGRDRHRSGA
jgi:hypothetical protein